VALPFADTSEYRALFYGKLVPSTYDHRPSMLADLEAGRPLELDPQLGAVVEIAQRLEVPAPFMRSILALTRLINPAQSP
jgi:2-dehydropantoate 2-reductase